MEASAALDLFALLFTALQFHLIYTTAHDI